MPRWCANLSPLLSRSFSFTMINPLRNKQKLNSVRGARVGGRAVAVGLALIAQLSARHDADSSMAKSTAVLVAIAPAKVSRCGAVAALLVLPSLLADVSGCSCRSCLSACACQNQPRDCALLVCASPLRVQSAPSHRRGFPFALPVGRTLRVPKFAAPVVWPCLVAALSRCAPCRPASPACWCACCVA